MMVTHYSNFSKYLSVDLCRRLLFTRRQQALTLLISRKRLGNCLEASAIRHKPSILIFDEIERSLLITWKPGLPRGETNVANSLSAAMLLRFATFACLAAVNLNGTPSGKVRQA